MNARNSEQRRNEPNFAKGVALVATGLVVTLGAGALLIGSQGDKSTEPDADRTRTNASRPAWAGTVVAASSRDSGAADVADVAATPAPAPAIEPEPVRTAPITWDEAQAAWDTGNWSTAADLFDGYSVEHPGNPWGHYMKGLALRQAGELDGAERALLDCVAIDPDHAKALVNLARVRLDLERPADAVEPVEHAVELDAENVAARRVLARTYHSQGRREAAEESYLAALALDSDDAWSLNNLGLLRIEEERFEEAIAPLERACAVDAGQARFFNNLGVARERTRRYRAAEQAYTRAMSLDPSSAKAEVSLARIAPLGGPVDEPVGVLAVGPNAGPITEAPGEIPQEDGREH